MDKNYLKELDNKIGTIKENGSKVIFASLWFDAVFKRVCTNYAFFTKKLLNYSLPININKNNKITVLGNELIKSKLDDYHSTADLFFKVNNDVYVSFEMNTEYFEDVKYRNFMLLNKQYVSVLKQGENIKKLKQIYIYQVNFNMNTYQNNLPYEEVILQNSTKNIIYINNYNIYNENLDFYENLYYNGNRDTKTCLMASILSKNFSELYERLRQVFTEKQTKQIIEGVIDMTFTETEPILTEWEAYLLERDVQMEKKDRIKREMKEARESGLEQEFEQGANQKELSIVQNMLKQNFSLEDTAKATGLPIYKVKQLQTNL